MKFTYHAYSEMIKQLRNNGYAFCGYNDCDEESKKVILRHDIDYSVDKAVTLARLEKQLGVKSTYFVLLTSNLYNLASRETLMKIKEINSLGHDIGLHFDETNYDLEDADVDEIRAFIINELSIMKALIGDEIQAVSMHRPSQKSIEANYDLSPAINSYGSKFFTGYKYVSDSRRFWREDIDGIIRSGDFDKLHILTHAFWYDENEKSIEEAVSDFIMSGNIERYNIMEDNITALNNIMVRPKDDK